MEVRTQVCPHEPWGCWGLAIQPIHVLALQKNLGPGTSLGENIELFIVSGALRISKTGMIIMTSVSQSVQRLLGTSSGTQGAQVVI